MSPFRTSLFAANDAKGRLIFQPPCPDVFRGLLAIFAGPVPLGAFYGGRICSGPFPGMRSDLLAVPFGIVLLPYIAFGFCVAGAAQAVRSVRDIVFPAAIAKIQSVFRGPHAEQYNTKLSRRYSLLCRESGRRGGLNAASTNKTTLHRQVGRPFGATNP